MTGLHLEYAEFHLIDPSRLDDHLVKARVMTIGALLGCDYLNLSGTPRQVGLLLNRVINGMSHRPAERAQLNNRSISAGTWQLYFCSRCGGRLLPNRCAGCGYSYTHHHLLGGRQANLPAKVRAYAEHHGHRFQ